METLQIPATKTGAPSPPNSTVGAADVSIICVNWNSVDYMRQCIYSIREFTPDLSLEIVVVDNASPDGRAGQLKAEFPEITLIESKENLGFSRANNLGFQHSTGAYLLFLNPDTKLISPAILLLLEAGKALPNAGVLGCRLLNSDMSFQTSSVQRFPTILNQMFDHTSRADVAPPDAGAAAGVPVDMVSGACMLLPREVFIRAGRFSEDYFMYAEDVDLCFKVNKLGMKVYYCPAPAIIHFGGGSSSQTGVEQFVVVGQKTAIMKFCRKTRGPVYAGMYRLLMGLTAVARITVLGMLLPFGRPNIRWSMRKWAAVLKWAAGISPAK